MSPVTVLLLSFFRDKDRTVSLVNDPDCDGKTPLHYACYSNNKELVKQLLQAGADPNARLYDTCYPYC